MLKKLNIRIELFLPVIFIFSFAFSGCFAPSIKPADKKRYNRIRNENMQNEVKFIEKNSTGKKSEKAPVETINGVLTLENAINYALKNNLDAEVKKLDGEINREAVAGARLSMLPSLKLEGELSRRSELDATSSDPLFSSSIEDFSYSRDKTSQVYNIELAWDILDFGISYYRQRQAFNKFNISNLKYRRVIQNLKFDIIKAYYMAQVSKAATDNAKALVILLKEHEGTLKNQIDTQIMSKIKALETSAALSEMKMKMSRFEFEFKRNKNKLVSLIGLPDYVDFEIEEADFNPDFEEIDIDIKNLEKEALKRRPELREQDMEELITADEAKIAIAESMPKPVLFYRHNYDKDSHLYHDQWQNAGIRLSFKMLSIPKNLSDRRSSLTQKRLIKKRRLSIAAAIIAQLNLAIVNFKDSGRNYRDLKEISDKRKQLMDAHRSHSKLGTGVYEDVIKSESQYLFARVRTITSHAELMIAEQRIINSIGFDHDRPEHLFLNLNKKEISKYPYTIRLSSWKNKKNAVEKRLFYQNKGIETYLTKAYLTKKGYNVWRCCTGSFRTRKEAYKAKKKLGIKKSSIIKTPYNYSLNDPEKL